MTAPKLSLPPLDWARPPAGRAGSPILVSLAIVLTFAIAILVASFNITADETVSASGFISPVRVRAVRATEAGVVSSIAVATGDTVRTGQTLIRLDSLEATIQLSRLREGVASLERQLAAEISSAPIRLRQQAELISQADARLVGARAGLRDLMLSYQRPGSIDSMLADHVPGGHIAIDQAVSEVRGAAAALNFARQALDLQNADASIIEQRQSEIRQRHAEIGWQVERIRRLSVTAPSSGVVLSEDLDQLLGVTVRPGDALLELADTTSWLAYLLVGERQVERVRPGNLVRITVPAFGSNQRSAVFGHVTAVSAQLDGTGAALQGTPGAVRPATAGAFRVVVALDSLALNSVSASQFRRGYTIEAKIVTRRDRVLSLFVRRLLNSPR